MTKLFKVKDRKFVNSSKLDRINESILKEKKKLGDNPIHSKFSNPPLEKETFEQKQTRLRKCLQDQVNQALDKGIAKTVKDGDYLALNAMKNKEFDTELSKKIMKEDSEILKQLDDSRDQVRENPAFMKWHDLIISSGPLDKEAINPKIYLDPAKSKKDKLAVCSKALHPEFSYPLIEVAEMSIEKGYEPFNWLKKDSPVTASYLIAAAQRHLDAVKMGVDRNREERRSDGTSCNNNPLHAAQVAYNMLMLCLMQQKGVLKDDRLFSSGEVK